MKKFEGEWLDYRANVVHKDAGEAQLKETKRAFYAGASSIITMLVGLFNPTTPEPTEEDVQQLDAVWKELGEFFEAEKRAVMGFKDKKVALQ